MVRLPLHPRLARLLLRARDLGCLRLGADLAALLTERDIFRSGTAGRGGRDPDIGGRIDAMRRARGGRDAGEAEPSALRAVERTAGQLLRLVPGTGQDPAGGPAEPDLLARLLLSAFPDRVCKRREEAVGAFVHIQGRGVRLSRESHLASEPYIIAVHADAGEGTEGFVHLAAPVTEALIRSDCADRIVRVRRLEWDRMEDRVVAAMEERLGSLVLARRPFVPTGGEVGPILCDAVRANASLLKFSREADQLRARAALISKAFPEESWPDLSEGRLAAHAEKWLPPFLAGVTSTRGLAGLDLLPALKAQLTHQQQRLLDERAPLAITVPSGSRITIDYTAGDLPVLAVKLQEMFGLADTPMIAGGRVKVLLHLLSPARRPVQVTQDLRNFWNNGYPEVKKDLKGRYPRHPWPDDPWNAVPTKRTKPRGK
jgi:ATP-dependent helicase HrpB